MFIHSSTGGCWADFTFWLLQIILLCSHHHCTNLFKSLLSILSGIYIYISRSEIAVSYGNSIFNFLRIKYLQLVLIFEDIYHTYCFAVEFFQPIICQFPFRDIFCLISIPISPMIPAASACYHPYILLT